MVKHELHGPACVVGWVEIQGTALPELLKDKAISFVSLLILRPPVCCLVFQREKKALMFKVETLFYIAVDLKVYFLVKNNYLYRFIG